MQLVYFLIVSVDMLAYAFDNPQPSTTIVLITGDRDFAYAVAVLRLRQFHVVVISPSVPSPHASLTAHASMCIDWNTAIMQKIGLEASTPQAVPPDRTKTESPPCPPNSAPAACPTTQPVKIGTTDSPQSSQAKSPSPVPTNPPKPTPLTQIIAPVLLIPFAGLKLLILWTVLLLHRLILLIRRQLPRFHSSRLTRCHNPANCTATRPTPPLHKPLVSITFKEHSPSEIYRHQYSFLQLRQDTSRHRPF